MNEILLSKIDTTIDETYLQTGNSLQKCVLVRRRWPTQTILTIAKEHGTFIQSVKTIYR